MKPASGVRRHQALILAVAVVVAAMVIWRFASPPAPGMPAGRADVRPLAQTASPDTSRMPIEPIGNPQQHDTSTQVTYRIHGRVTNEAGQPVARELVWAEPWPQGSPEPGQEDVTDALGTYRLEGVPPGNRMIGVFVPGYLPRDEFMKLEGPPYERTVDLALSRGGWVRGRVLDIFGNPIAGALVTDYATPPAYTDATGAFELAGLKTDKEGRLWGGICATAKNHAETSVEASPGDEITIRLVPTHRVEMVLTNWPTLVKEIEVLIDPVAFQYDTRSFGGVYGIGRSKSFTRSEESHALRLPPGDFKLSIKHFGARWESTVNVREGESPSLSVDLSPFEPDPQRLEQIKELQAAALRVAQEEHDLSRAPVKDTQRIEELRAQQRALQKMIHELER